MTTTLNPNSETNPSPASCAIPAASVTRPLNCRQEKFCAQYSISGNATEAAKLAGYSERSAHNHGARLARDPRIGDRVYRIRVNRAFQFGPVMAFTRLDYLFRKASEAGDYRGAAAIVTLQARLSGVESWISPAAAEKAGYQPPPRQGRGALGPRKPFDNLTENHVWDNDDPDGND